VIRLIAPGRLGRQMRWSPAFDSARKDGLKNRRLSLRWFEPNTCHTLVKRRASCGFSASGPFLFCPVMCHLVALQAVMLRCPRTHSGRASVPLQVVAPIILIWTRRGPRRRARPAVPNGGSARGYLGRWRGLSVPYGLLDWRPFCIFMHRHLWGECPHLPPTGRGTARADLTASDGRLSRFAGLAFGAPPTVDVVR
jgi:hypothetical protein